MKSSGVGSVELAATPPGNVLEGDLAAGHAVASSQFPRRVEQRAILAAVGRCHDHRARRARRVRDERPPRARAAGERPRSLPRRPARVRPPRRAGRPHSCSASSRDAARSSWRTRPAIRATTSRNSAADATISTTTSAFVEVLHESDARRDQAGAGEQGETGRGQPSPHVRRTVARACASTGAARRRPRARSTRSSRRRRSAGGRTCPSAARTRRASR